MTSKEKTYEACAAAGATSWRAWALGESDKLANENQVKHSATGQDSYEHHSESLSQMMYDG